MGWVGWVWLVDSSSIGSGWKVVIFLGSTVGVFFFWGELTLFQWKEGGKNMIYIYTPLEKKHILLYKLHKLTLTCVLFFMANQPTPPKYPPANKDLLRAYKPLDSFGEAFLNPCFAGMFAQVSKKTISYHQIQIIIRIPYFESKDFCLVEGRLISTASTIGI